MSEKFPLKAQDMILILQNKTKVNNYRAIANAIAHAYFKPTISLKFIE